MSERIDHARVARNNLDYAAAVTVTTDAAAVTVAAAQVHAMLALVEQQRIATLIAIGEHTELIGNGQVLEKVLRTDVREGLGL